MKARILIAEDDVDIRDLMKLYLESEGYEILCSGDGAEALSLIEAYNPQLAILDIMMPSMTGLEVTQVLRKTSLLWGRIPIRDMYKALFMTKMAITF